MKWQITTPPSIEPLIYDDVAAQARIENDNDQYWVESFVIPNARATAEKEAQVSLITQTIAATIYNEQDAGLHWSHSEIRLPRGPVQSITSVVDGNGSTLSTTLYQIRRHGLNDFLHLTAGQKFALTITYVAGYGNTGDAIPADIKGIMLAHCSFLYDNRGADVDPTALDRIYRKYRSFAQ